MRFLHRYFPDRAGPHRSELPRLIAMMGLFFLVVCAVGILGPIRNTFALDGLGQSDFYKVYLVSAVVTLFVPIYNKLSDRLPWRWLIPVVAMSFGLELLLFRVFYVEGSGTFGLMFYGWYDLFGAALLTQFFMATQMFLNARSAKQAYPLVIAGGSVGAGLGSLITGFLSTRVGTPNLMLIAAALIFIFSALLPLVWAQTPPPTARRRNAAKLATSELRALLNNRHVRLIAISVLITVVVKQLIDYQFNTMTKEVLQDRDAMSAFQGKVKAVTNWLPILPLVLLHPMLKRWGVGVAVLVLPVAMLMGNLVIEIWWGLWAVLIARGTENTLRYSTERAAREILYVPVPDEIKLKAKAYIDVAIEKGLGKVVSALLILILLRVMDYHQFALVGMALCLVWLALSLKLRGEYTRSLAQSIQGRFASLRGSFATIADANTRQAVARALSQKDRSQVAFALDLAEQGAPDDLQPLAAELKALLDHTDETIRRRALEVLARRPDLIDAQRIGTALEDDSAPVREAAVALLCRREDPTTALGQLLQSADARVRTAALACIARGVVPADAARSITREYIAQREAAAGAGDREARREVALAAGALDGDVHAVQLLQKLIRDEDAEVACAALHAAGQSGAPVLWPLMMDALAEPKTRHAARAALIAVGDPAVPALAQRLLDTRTPSRERRQIPSVLSQAATPAAVQALLYSYLAPETDQLLDFRTLKALSKLRARSADLVFEREAVLMALRRDAADAHRYDRVRAAVAALNANGPATQMLLRALEEAWTERRESGFRLLGLLYPGEAVRDCHHAVSNGGTRERANALEWLEQTMGRELVGVATPLLAGLTAEPERSPTAVQALESLRDDNDRWIALLSDACGRELYHARVSTTTENGMDLIEKVFLLQQVDLLQDARSGHLALLASIAVEHELPANHVVIRQAEPTRAMYLVIRGAVELRGAGDQTMIAGERAAFGTWALIDQAPSLVSARTLEPTSVLVVERDDFHDLLNENPEFAVGLLQGLARRVRSLVA